MFSWKHGQTTWEQTFYKDCLQYLEPSIQTQVMHMLVVGNTLNENIVLLPPTQEYVITLATGQTTSLIIQWALLLSDGPLTRVLFMENTVTLTDSRQWGETHPHTHTHMITSLISSTFISHMYVCILHYELWAVVMGSSPVIDTNKHMDLHEPSPP